MNETLVLSSSPANGVRVLAFNRPTKRNALSQSLIVELLTELEAASNDDTVRAIVITGNDTFFCGLQLAAGADIKEIAALDAEAARKCRYLENLCHGLANVRKPLIAAVEGMALGGGFEVALACDMIFASKSARFGLPEISIGLIPGAAGTQRLTSAMGKFKAMQVVLLGEQIEASQAHANGLVADVFEPGSVLENAVKAASKLAAMSPTALSLAKEAICRADQLGRDDEFERSLYYHAFGTADKREGISAFLEKRKPTWNMQ
ncbi:ClpP/crotonase-like domain-containing protein [Stachybotrys elegans]|uniref:ClpP/crotonase-like domain-containing protein n=1 Tax=Stachybotrys elegans TaxID=80388 RepID=A0A8K0SF96_9HYPO|nr:ClpP/crotonase-like domain-containing protein [Stachybotrys elegans]